MGSKISHMFHHDTKKVDATKTDAAKPEEKKLLLNMDELEALYEQGLINPSRMKLASLAMDDGDDYFDFSDESPSSDYYY